MLSCKDNIPTQSWAKRFIAELNTDKIELIDELLQALLAVYNKVAMQLYNDTFEPVFLELIELVDWHQGSAASVIEWCFGYCQGMEFSPSLWLEEQYEYSMPIAMLGGGIDINDEDLPTEEELKELSMMIPSLAQSTYNIAFDAREEEKELRSTIDKPGRNDPCQCGSGKKYKKCCLREVQTIH